MKKCFCACAILALALGISGCGGGGEPGGNNDLSATFMFSATSTTTSGNSLTGTAILMQSGSSVTGTAMCTGAGGTETCDTTATFDVTGSVSGASVTLSVATFCDDNGVAVSDPITINATIESGGGTIMGTYSQAANSSCGTSADMGNVTLTKAST